MNDPDKMPSKCYGCPLWEIAISPWICYECKEAAEKDKEKDN